jgi:hypothetical protein
MKIKVVVHEAEEGAIGQKFPPCPGVPPKVKPSRNYSPTFTKPLRDVCLWMSRELSRTRKTVCLKSRDESAFG